MVISIQDNYRKRKFTSKLLIAICMTGVPFLAGVKLFSSSLLCPDYLSDPLRILSSIPMESVLRNI
jgi:hypothetical protein